ncbi:MAG: hypothetical protein GX856_08745 [Gammaproteobacteria bacterium]|nr:hypothetical protein [Gammaproteobacteria bacterium]
MSETIDLTSPEVKQAIAEAVAEEVKGLKAKNAELIELNKKLRRNAEIDPADLEAVERERDEWKDKAMAAEKAAKRAATDLEVATKARDEIANAYTGSLKDAALTDALTKAGVTNPVHLTAAKALLGGSVEVAEENGARVVKAGDKSLGDFITEWAGGEEGKHFRANGADGGNASALPPGGESLKRSGMSVAAKAEYIGKHGVDAYNKLPE